MRKNNKKYYTNSLKKFLFNFNLFLIVLSVISIVSFVVSNRYLIFSFKNEKRKDISESLIAEVNSIKKYINIRTKNFDELIRRELQTNLKNTIRIINEIYNKMNTTKKIKNENEIKRLIFSVLRNINYKNGLEYIYINDDKGNVLFNAIFPQIENKNLIELKDANGKPFIKEVTDKALKNGNGFVTYYWKYKNSGKMEKKITYFEYLKNLKWIVGITVFYKDVEENLKTEIIDKIKTTVLPNYISLIVYDECSRKIFVRLNYEGDISIPEFKDQSFFSLENNYFAYGTYVDSLDWGVIAFLNKKNIDTLLKNVVNNYYKNVNVFIVVYVLIVSFAIIIHYIFSLKLNRQLVTNFNNLLDFIRNTKSYLFAPDFSFDYNEFDEIKNVFLETLKKVRSEKSFREKVLDRIDKGIIILNSDFKIEYTNPKSEEILNMSKQLLRGKEFFDVIKVHRISNMQELDIKTYIIKKATYKPKPSKRFYFVTDDKYVIPVRVSYSFIDGDDDKKLLVVFEDISREIEKEKFLLELKNKAQESSIQKSRFIANMSHEVRTPLTGIIGFQDLLMKTKLTDEQKRFLKIASESAHNLLNTINEILEVSKIKSNTLVLDERTFNIKNVLESCIKTFEGKAIQKGLILSYHLDESVPENLVGDKIKLSQVLNNLLNNAIKFTESGYIKLQVKVVRKSEKYVYLKFIIEDSGIGIPKEKMQSIFDAFTQVDSADNRKYGGTGLGLNISYELIKLMGGSLEVDSEEGKGTVFTFVLKFKIGDKFVTVSPKFNSELVKNKELKILIAEDDIFNQEFLKEVFKKFGIQPEFVSNGKECLERLESEVFDLIFLDIEMPIMDGIQTIKEIKRRSLANKSIIIALTGHSDKEIIKKFNELGFDFYLTKPFDVNDISNIIQEVTFINNKDNDFDVQLNEYFELNELSEVVGDAQKFLQDMLPSFLDSLKNSIDKLKKYLYENKFDEAKKIIHSIKGSSGNIRARALYEVTVELETIIDESPENAIELINKLETILSEINKAFYKH